MSICYVPDLLCGFSWNQQCLATTERLPANLQGSLCCEVIFFCYTLTESYTKEYTQEFMKKISYFNCHKQKNFHDFLEMKALRRRASKRDTSAGVKRSVDLSLPSISWKVHHCISICLPLSTLRFCVYIDIQPLHNQQNIGPCLSDMVSPSLTVQSVWS
jgi:hypothetical protein